MADVHLPVGSCSPGLSPALPLVFADLEGSSLSLTLMETKAVEEKREAVSRQRETDIMAV